MSLKLIEKYKIEDLASKPHIRIVQELSANERLLLAELFILEGIVPREQKQQILNLCKIAHERDLWVQCDCVERVYKPVFRFNRASSGKLYLHHITSRGVHAINCPFKEKNWTNQNSSKHSKPFIKNQTALDLLPKKTSGLIPKKEQGGTNETNMSSGRRSKLCRALYRLLDDAEVNVLQLDKNSIPIQAIENAASKIELQSNKSMKDYFYSNPSQIFKIAYQLKDDKSYWQKDTRKHALLLVKAKSFDEHSIDALLPTGATQRISIANRIYMSSGRFGVRSGPFMAFILITDSSLKPGFYEPFNAFIVPCYSEKTYIPVDSYYEREVLRKLFALQFEMKKQNLSLKIIKPLFDIPVHSENDDEEVVLPDFIVQNYTSRIVVEVNGSHEAEYLARKERMHHLMKNIGPVLSIDAFGEEKKNNLTEGINYLMREIKKLLK